MSGLTNRIGLLRRPGLAFPGGNPGFDPSHVAVGGGSVRVAAAMPSMFNMAPGGKSATWGTSNLTLSTLSVGKTFNFSTNGSGSYINYNVGAGGSDTAVTMAFIIFTPSSLPATRVLMDTGTTGFSTGGYTLITGPTPVILEIWKPGFVQAISTITLAVSAPYFFAVSSGSVSTNFVAVRLDTGSRSTSTVAGLVYSGSPSSQNTCVSAATPTDNHQPLISVAAAMHSSAYLSMASLLRWAADPWSFWYPSPPGFGLDSEISGAAPSSVTYFFPWVN